MRDATLANVTETTCDSLPPTHFPGKSVFFSNLNDPAADVPLG